MLKLKKINFANIGRFIEEQVIDLDSLSSLTQIDANNNNTGGASSGSGKSTVLNAIDFAFGISDLSISILQSRLTKSHISVSLELDWDGKSVTITRAKKLTITVDGEETSGSSAITEAKLDEIIGMDRKLFRLMIHRRQGERGFFLEMTASKMNDFLVDCLGLSAIRSKIDVIDLKAKELALTKTKAENDLQSAQAALEATKSAIDSLGQDPTTDITEALVEGWRGQYEQCKTKLIDKQAIHKQEKEVLDQRKPNLVSIPFDRSILDTITKEIKELDKSIYSVLDVEKSRKNKIDHEINNLKANLANQVSIHKLEHNTQISDAKTTLFNLSNISYNGNTSKERAVVLAGQIKTLRSGMCQTCLQPWQKEEAKNEEERLMKELGEHRVNMEAGVSASKEADTIKLALVSLQLDYKVKIASLEEECKSQLALLEQQTNNAKEVNTELQDLNVKLQEKTAKKIEEGQKEDVHNAEQNKANNELMSSFFLEQKALTIKHQEELSFVTKEVEENRSRYEQCRSAFKSQAEAAARYETTLKSLKNKEGETNQKVVDIDSKLVHTKENLEMAEEVKRCLKSYLSCSFDNALDSISDTATKILRSIPTMVNATLRLEGLRETKAGAVKEEVSTYIDNDGEINVPLKSLSGGEYSAVDLAVVFFVQEIANKGLDFMGLDEVFGGFDPTGIEGAIEMIKTAISDKKVFVIEHNGIAKEFIQDKITVIRDGETSSIK
jgi:DNA repair exonuclease SbcCD ATPase subunit